VRKVTSIAAAATAAIAIPPSTKMTILAPSPTNPFAPVAADAAAGSRRTATKPMMRATWRRTIVIWLLDLLSAAIVTALIEAQILRGLLS